MATRAEWTERVKRWKRSGLSAAEFVRREGLREKHLHWWVWKLGTSDTAPLPEEARFL
jgi:transposase